MRFLLDKRGSVVTAMFLIFMPLLLAGVILTTEHPRVVHGADVDLSQAVAEATRAAAMQVNEVSLARDSTLKVDPDQAHATFRRILTRNLKLSETLEPVKGSGVSSVSSYVFVVYSGDYSDSRKYTFANGVCSRKPFPYSGFPRTFLLKPNDILTYSSRAIKGTTITLDTPGCVAVVRVKMRPVLLKKETEAVRWAAARIIRD